MGGVKGATMTDEQWQCEFEALKCERDGYIAENMQRAACDHSMAYIADHFFELAQRFRALAEEETE